MLKKYLIPSLETQAQLHSLTFMVYNRHIQK